MKEDYLFWFDKETLGAGTVSLLIFTKKESKHLQDKYPKQVSKFFAKLKIGFDYIGKKTIPYIGPSQVPSQTEKVSSSIDLLSKNEDYSEDHYDARKERDERIAVIIEVQNIQTLQAFQAIVSALSDKNFFVRHAVARALTAFGSDSILLLIRTPGDKAWKPRSGAALSLVELKSFGSMKALNTSEKSMQRSIIGVLGQTGDSIAITPLSKLSENENVKIRQCAIKSLEQINTVVE